MECANCHAYNADGRTECRVCHQALTDAVAMAGNGPVRTPTETLPSILSLVDQRRVAPGSLAVGLFGVVVAGIVAVVRGLPFTFPILLPILAQEYGLARTEAAAIFSLNIFVYALGACIILATNARGRSGGRVRLGWGTYVVMAVGSVSLALATAASALSNTLVLLYLFLGVLLPVASALALWPLHLPTLASLFSNGRDRLVGAQHFHPAVGIAFTLFLAIAVPEFGWREALRSLALVPTALLIPLYGLFIYYAYAPDRRMPPESESNQPGEAVHRGKWGRPGVLGVMVSDTLSVALWSAAFWLVMVHQVAFLWDFGVGWSESLAAFALILLSALAAQLTGFVARRLGSHGTVALRACE